MDRKCSFPGCERPYWARDLCSAHYWQKYTGKVELHPLGVRIHPRFQPHCCEVPECGRKVHGHGLCKLHWKYKQHGWELKPIGKRKGVPLAAEIQQQIRDWAQLPILEGRAIFLSYGYPNVEVWENGKVKRVRLHRAVMEKVLGRQLKPREVVHHINQNKIDCRPENLEIFTSNAEHLSKHHGRPQRAASAT